LTPAKVSFSPEARVTRTSNAQSGSEKLTPVAAPAAAVPPTGLHPAVPDLRISIDTMLPPVRFTSWKLLAAASGEDRLAPTTANDTSNALIIT
jgi:hypothetical protein